MRTTPPPPVPFALPDPLWAIEHLARLFRVEVDTTRELTYRTASTAPVKIGRRWLVPGRGAGLGRRAEALHHRRAQARRHQAAAEPAPAPAPVRPYTPRRKPGAAA